MALIWAFFYQILTSFCTASDFDIHIMFAMDKKILLPTTVCIASILNSTTKSEKLHFHFVGGNPKNIIFEKIFYLKDKFRNFSLEYVSFNLSRLLLFQTSRNHKIMLKFFVAEIFPILSRVLWLDSDTLVLKNIRGLFETNMDGKYVAAVDVCRSVCLYPEGVCGPLHFNAGVILFNLELMREKDLQNFFFRARKKRMLFSGRDEFVISSVVKEEGSVILPGKFNNVMTSAIWGSSAWNCSRLFDEAETVILHYYGNPKPWKGIRGKIKPVYFEIYQKYYRLIENEPKKRWRKRKSRWFFW